VVSTFVGCSFIEVRTEDGNELCNIDVFDAFTLKG
jgi:hypothetical protein